MQSQIWKTILVLMVANLIAYSIWPYQALIYIAIGLGIISLLAPKIAKWIHIAWMKLAEGLGWVNSRILLSLVFFLLLTPIALLVRLFRKDPLQLKRPQSESLFFEREHIFTPEDLKNPW